MKANMKRKLLLMISALILVSVMLVTVLTNSTYRDDLVAQNTQGTQQLLEQLSINVDNYLDELFRLCLSPYYNKRVMEQLESAPKNAAELLQKQRIIEDYLTEVMTLPRSDILRAHILSDGVYSSSKTRYSSDIPADYAAESWYQQAMNSKEAIFLPAHIERQGKSSLAVFGVAQRINSTRDSDQVVGVIRVDANYNGLKAVCDRAGITEGSALYILDGSGNSIYGNNKTGQQTLITALTDALAAHENETGFTLAAGHETYLVNAQTLSMTKWRIIDVHSMRVLTAPAAAARNKAFLLALLCAVVGVLISIPLVRRFLKPIQQITTLMHTAQSGDMTVRAPVVGHDELAYLSKSFNEMIAQIHEETERNTLLTRQVYEARYLEKEAQYAALCNQIRPHFLFNALNTIHLLIKTGRDDEAVQCIDMLAMLLRGLVNADREITLRAEMKIVESYLTLQQKRYPSLRYSLPDIGSLESYALPALTLQPLVENALVHGCEPKRGSACVNISISNAPDALLIVISDNGMGMEADTLARVRAELADASMEPATADAGVGLVNIARRVKLKFGAEYGLSITSAVGEGTCVTLRLPLKGETSCIAQ